MRLAVLSIVWLMLFVLTAMPAAAANDIDFEHIPFENGVDGSKDAGRLQQVLPIGQTQGASQSQETIPIGEPQPASDTTEFEIAGVEILKEIVKAEPPQSLCDFTGYRYSSSALEFIPNSGNDFAIFSAQWNNYEKPGFSNNIISGFRLYAFSGPVENDLPPRVYDFSIGYQLRDSLGPVAFDLAFSVRAASDFNGDASDGIQYPGHGVGYLSIRPELDLVFGVEYLDRADIKLLPVAGVIWKPRSDMRFEFVFPRPRIIFQLSEEERLYFSGELGGGTWAIERPGLENNLATYSDLRFCAGFASWSAGSWSSVEVGYLFDRRLEFTTNAISQPLKDALLIRLAVGY